VGHVKVAFVLGFHKHLKVLVEGHRDAELGEEAYNVVSRSGSVCNHHNSFSSSQEFAAKLPKSF
jgi:hypothetical protein